MQQVLSGNIPSPDTAGYTLIEVLIAIAIFSIGIMAMGSLQTASLMSTGDIGRGTMAMALLDEQAESLKALPFYQTVNGLDYDGNGAIDGSTTQPAALTGGTHGPFPDGPLTFSYQVTDDQPIAQQNAADLPFSGLPAGNYSVSKTITVWVNGPGSTSQADAIAEAEFVKVWVADGVEG